MDKHSIAEARRNLPRLVHEAEKGKALMLTRRGEPAAVLISHRQFDQLVAGRSGFAERYRAYAESVSLAGLAFDPDEFLRGVRETASGRDVDF